MLKEKIKNKEKIIGTHIMMSDIISARIMGLAGYDYIWVDTEHNNMTLETLLAHIFTLKSTGTPVIVRVPQDDLTATKKVVEMGVDGIIFPMVKTAEEADRLIASTLYPPYGTRGFGPMNAVDYGLKNVGEYVKNTCDNMCRFIQIEHKDAIENLDEIMKNPYIDGYIFGPNDLSGSYDMLGDVYCDKITDAIKDVVKRLHDNGKYVGLSAGGYGEEVIRHWSSLGIDMLSSGSDFDFMRDGAVQNRINLETLYKSR